MAVLMKKDKPFNPMNACLFSSETEMSATAMVETKSSKRGGLLAEVGWPHNFSSYGGGEKDISLQLIKL